MATDSVVGAAADSSVEYAPAAVRNREVLTDALRTALASAERLYEVGAGTGCHTAFLADTFPDLLIQPTDLEVSCWHRCVVAVHFVGLSVFCVPLTHSLSLSPSAAILAQASAVDTIARAVGPRRNVAPPAVCDVTADPARWPLPAAWPPSSVDVMLSCNMVHISPPATSAGLFRGAGTLLKPDSGSLFLYGPFRMGAAGLFPDSNHRFEAWLKEKDARFGIRDVLQLSKEASGHGLALVAVTAMPANNWLVHFRRQSDGDATAGDDAVKLVADAAAAARAAL